MVESQPRHQTNHAKSNAKTIKWLVLLVFGMFVFAFAQIQLYGLFCKAVGVNSLSSRQKVDDYQYSVSQAKLPDATANQSLMSNVVNDTRLITVRFDANVNEGIPWSFIPVEKKVAVHPGELKQVTYKVKNLTNEVITGQSIANITPWQAEPYLSKIECFCHTQQTLQPGEEKDMPLVFTVSDDLPEEMGTLVVSYTFLNAEKQSAKKYQQHIKTL